MQPSCWFSLWGEVLKGKLPLNNRYRKKSLSLIHGMNCLLIFFHFIISDTFEMNHVLIKSSPCSGCDWSPQIALGLSQSGALLCLSLSVIGVYFVMSSSVSAFKESSHDLTPTVWIFLSFKLFGHLIRDLNDALNCFSVAPLLYLVWSLLLHIREAKTPLCHAKAVLSVWMIQASEGSGFTSSLAVFWSVKLLFASFASDSWADTVRVFSSVSAGPGVAL